MSTMARKLTIASASSLSVAERAKLGTVKKTPILNVMGRTGEYKFGQTSTGDYIKFWGQFEAQDLMTGEVTVSGVAIFPGVLADTLCGAIGKDQARTVEFAGVFGVEPTKKADSSIPWQYYFEPVVNVGGNTDALADLRKHLKAIPAPGAAPQVEHKPEGAPAKKK